MTGTNWQDFPAAAPALDDTLLIRDVSDNAGIAAGKVKQVTMRDLLALLSGGGAGGTGGGGTGGGGTAGLTVTVATPDQVSSSDGAASSVTPFSPAAGSMVRISATWLDAEDQLGKTFTCEDSNGVSYTATLAGGDSDGGCYLLIFDHVYAAAPGAVTVTITAAGTGATAAADALIQPYLITGQAVSQAAAARNSVSGDTSITTCEIPLTTTQAGSVVMVLGAPNNAGHPVPTPVSGTTITDAEWDDDNVGSHGVIGHSPPTGAPGPKTYGWTLSAASVFGFGAIACEVLAAGGGAGSGGSSAFTAVGGWTETTGLSFTWTPAAIGNVLVVIAFSTDASAVTALASGNADWAKIVSGIKVGSTTVTQGTAFTGTATSTGEETVTLTTGASDGDIRLLAHEFSTGGVPVTLDKFATSDPDAGPPVTAWPSVSPAGSGELLFGFERNIGDGDGGAVTGSTGGVAYDVDSNGNGGAYSLAVSSPLAVGWGDSDSRAALVLLLTAGAGGGGGGGGGGTGGGFTASTVPLLGMYQTNGAFPTPGPSAWASGPKTNITATYIAWDSDGWTEFVEPFLAQCKDNGLVPFVELEPWGFDQSPVLFSSILAGDSDALLEQIGASIASFGQPVILTFAHEMNVSGQYPWAQGDSGSGAGGGELSPDDWILGWNYVRSKVNESAGGNAVWLWGCSAWTGGTTIDPSPWWPGSDKLDMVGIDGYPDTEFGQSLGTFDGQLGKTVNAIRQLGWAGPVFISETNLREMTDSGGQDITSFVADMAANGISGILEFEDASWGLSKMTAAQWAEYNNAVAANYGT